MRLWVDSIPNDPVLLVAKGGAAGGGCANALEEEFPPQWLVGVDRLRCKWLNLNLRSVGRWSGCTANAKRRIGETRATAWRGLPADKGAACWGGNCQ